MFGIEDPGIWMAYLLCILSCALGVVYGIVNWNRGSEPIEAADIEWAEQQDETEQEI